MPLTEAKTQLLRLLKGQGPLAAPELARRLGTTAVAVRQHLAALEEAGLVTSATPSPHEGRPRGRPSARWSLTEAARPLFPDEHAELAVGLIHAIRRSAGERGLAGVIEARAEQQIDAYRRELPGGASLRKRVEALARRRTREGYMAEVVQVRPGEYLLIERHCPICDAARACQGLCSAELRVFRETLGPEIEVERTEHLLADGERCAYRIRKSAQG